MKYSGDWLKKKFDGDGEIEYFFFWGHQPSKDGSLSGSCFSQWWLMDFEVKGMKYPSAEHFMMAEKARLFKDEETLAEILTSKTPAEAKRLGRKVKDFDESIWLENRTEIVVRGNLAKFSTNEEMKNFLLSTGDKVIVEASPRDRIWGIGMGQNNPDAKNPYKWRGSNLLGFALMEVRDELRIKINK